MKAIFNQGTSSEFSLSFTQIAETFSENFSQTLSLELRKTDLDVNESMISYCAPILQLDSIDTIHCYSESENKDDKLVMIFNKYNTIFNCRTTLEDVNAFTSDVKTGILTLVQK